MKSTMKLILLSIAAIAAFTSCNTMIGLGRDTRILGEGVEKAAEKSVGGSEYEADNSGAPIY
jgi:predicted small secreted protein